MTNPLSTDAIVNWVNSLPNLLIIIVFILGVLFAIYGGKESFKNDFKKEEKIGFIISNILIAGVLFFTMNKPLIIIQIFLIIESAEIGTNQSINWNPIIVIICYLGFLYYSLIQTFNITSFILLIASLIGIITYISSYKNRIKLKKQKNE